MTNKELKNIKLVGEGSSSGGDYEKITVTGKGQIHGDVNSKVAKIMGECNITGNANIDQFRLTGKSHIDGKLQTDEMRVTGDLMVTDTIRSLNASVRGFVSASGNVEMESMNIKGGFHIDGLLNVGDLTVNLQIAKSKVKEIGGETISIKSKSLFNKPYSLEAEVIEGDNVYLEYSTVNVVRGAHVEIGPGCEIELVEYTSTFKCKEKDAKKIVAVTQI